MNISFKKLFVSTIVASTLAAASFGSASAATCWASSPAWSGYWTAPSLYAARVNALRQCQANTPYGMYCVVDNCDY